MYQVDFLLPLKLEEICYFGSWPQNTLGQSVYRIFSGLFGLLSLISGVHYYIESMSKQKVLKENDKKEVHQHKQVAIAKKTKKL